MSCDARRGCATAWRDSLLFQYLSSPTGQSIQLCKANTALRYSVGGSAWLIEDGCGILCVRTSYYCKVLRCRVVCTLEDHLRLVGVVRLYRLRLRASGVRRSDRRPARSMWGTCSLCLSSPLASAACRTGDCGAREGVFLDRMFIHGFFFRNPEKKSVIRIISNHNCGFRGRLVGSGKA